MKFSKDFMQELVCFGKYDGAEVISDKIIGRGDWNLLYEIVFSYNGRFYSSTYKTGSTEYQDERPYQYEDEIECDEVKPLKRTVIVYEKIKEAN